ncbi:MAG: hypothetical protein RL514_2680 [Verrucomicrobiota bacterium]|jgi:arylsulfatase A-like enzyme
MKPLTLLAALLLAPSVAIHAADAPSARPNVLMLFADVQRAVCDARWKLIRYPQSDRTQLFDLQSDPHEATNLAGKPEHAAKIAELTALLEKEMQRSGDTGVLKVPNPKPTDWAPAANKGKRKAKQ